MNFTKFTLSQAGCSKYKTFNVATPVPQAGQAVSFGLLTNLVQLRQDGGQLLLLDRQLKCIYSVNRSVAPFILSNACLAVALGKIASEN